jgi:hypothetical protein
MMRMARSPLAAVVLLCLSACGGSGGTTPVLQGVESPAGVPFSLSTRAVLTGAGLASLADPVLVVEGVARLPGAVLSDTQVAVDIPARAIPPGTHVAWLEEGARRTNPLPGGLLVNPQPTLDGCVPNRFAVNANEPFELVGTGFRAPMTFRFLDEAGSPLSPPRPVEVDATGTLATGLAPMLPGGSGITAAHLQIWSADGQQAVGGMPVTMDHGDGDVRQIDGRGNQPLEPAFGAAGIRLRREVAPAYADGISAPAGAGIASPREISNVICRQRTSPPNAVDASNMLWLWGQFLDHDIDLTGSADPEEPFDIAVPLGDASFDPTGTGTQTIPLSRSLWDTTSGTSTLNPRQQVNEITAFIDGSSVYGSDSVRAAALRTNDGTGRLRTSAGNLLPFNDAGLPNASMGGAPGDWFLAGDVRCNEQLGLTAMHTVFMREHNRRVAALSALNPHLDGEALYQAARAWVGALMQHITYSEFLPALLGPAPLPPYAGYDPAVQPDISNAFSTACYRFGHSLVPTTLPRRSAAGEPIAAGDLALRDAFFQPQRLVTEGGVDPVLRGLIRSPAEDLDLQIVDDLRDFLFGAPGAGGLDLAALNIQRGRDHGLPRYDILRTSMGLPSHTTFADITSDASTQADLAATYPTVAHVDLWVGALAEDKLPGALVGELLAQVLSDQFRRLRDGDRFWYERIFHGAALEEIRATRLADVIRRNTGIADEIPDDVFHLSPTP